MSTTSTATCSRTAASRAFCAARSHNRNGRGTGQEEPSRAQRAPAGLAGGDQSDARPRSCAKQARRASALLYFKDSASVQDFLTRIGAPTPRWAIKARWRKTSEHHQPSVNCETANLVKAAVRPRGRSPRSRCCAGRRGGLPDNLRETVRLRLSYPTDSLTELARRFDRPSQAGTEPQAER
ncbi:MAG: helix-turn-helix domain-containing protein [Butyricicoccus sp.]